MNSDEIAMAKTVDYLTLLGIETWRPKYSLPGANPNFKLEIFGLALADKTISSYLLLETNSSTDANQISAANDLLNAMLQAINLRCVAVDSVPSEFKSLLIMGETLAQSLLQSTQSLTQMREKNPLEITSKNLTMLISLAQASNEVIKTYVTYHPAYLLQNPANKRAAWEDLKLFAKILGIVK